MREFWCFGSVFNKLPWVDAIRWTWIPAFFYQTLRTWKLLFLLYWTSFIIVNLEHALDRWLGWYWGRCMQFAFMYSYIDIVGLHFSKTNFIQCISWIVVRGATVGIKNLIFWNSGKLCTLLPFGESWSSFRTEWWRMKNKRILALCLLSELQCIHTLHLQNWCFKVLPHESD